MIIIGFLKGFLSLKGSIRDPLNPILSFLKGLL